MSIVVALVQIRSSLVNSQVTACGCPPLWQEDKAPHAAGTNDLIGKEFQFHNLLAMKFTARMLYYYF